MAVPTPEQLRAALREHVRVKPACAALGTTLAGIRCKRADRTFLHPELVAVIDAHTAAQRLPRDKDRKAGRHTLALPPPIRKRLTVLCAARAAVVGPKRASRSAIARLLIDAALRGPLPAPLPGDGGLLVDLDLGPSWERLAAALDTTDPETIAGHVRAILAQQEIDT